MKKILIAFLLTTSTAFGMTSEFFDGMDANTLKAGISKYILTKGGNISHGESYSSNIIQASESVVVNRVRYKYNYLFQLIPDTNGTKLDLTVYQSSYGTPSQASFEVEKKVMNNIKNSVRGRLLYGLGFEYSIYKENGIEYKAPKGKETGIVITAVKYDAMKKGIIPGDKIIEINDIPIKDMPLEQYNSILYAKSVSDTLNLTLKRGESIYKVTITPRLNTSKTF